MSNNTHPLTNQVYKYLMQNTYIGNYDTTIELPELNSIIINYLEQVYEKWEHTDMTIGQSKKMRELLHISYPPKRDLKQELADRFKKYYYDHNKVSLYYDAFVHDKGECVAEMLAQTALDWFRENGKEVLGDEK